MPVIRIDDEVWKELQKRAEPLVDSPNIVLRKIFKLDIRGVNSKDKVIEIELGSLHSPRTFAVIPVPKKNRSFFPGYKVYFDLETDIGIIKTRMTSAPKGTPVGDPIGGAYIQGNLKGWFQSHPELKAGVRLRFETLEAGKRYKLSTLQP
jgi:hypothetical protein